MKQPNFYTSVLLAWLSATHTAYSELPKGKTWETSSFKEILQHYEFVADLRVRPAERHISKELFWRYPIPLPTAEFEIDHSLGDEAGEMPATEGATLPIRHMNLGRILYREGKYDQARRIWLTARARFGNIFEYHRRNDYLAAVAFLKLAQEKGKQFNYAYGDRNVRIPYSNVATFLSWAFIKKAHIPDPLLEQVAPKGLYLLAVLYLTFQRFNAAQATAASGLDFLKANGRNEYRTGFNEIIAENWIRNRDYYTAIRTLDENIRSTSEPKVAARAFHRIADIYFDLNQYDLADEVYRMAQAVDRHAYQIHPLSYFLRGESLFWRGLFKEAREALKYSLYANELPHAKPKLKTIFIAWAKLRLADTYLALYREHKDKGTKSSKELGKILSKAKLEYYKVSHHFPLTEPGEIAQVRRDCLELPVYQGNNVRHAQESLSAARHKDLPLKTHELAWSCEILSYATQKNMTRFASELNSFYHSHPKSRYIESYIAPLEKYRIDRLTEYIQQKKPYEAIEYYEKYKEHFLSQLSPSQQYGLFKAYYETRNIAQARPFAESFYKQLPHDQPIDLLRFLVFTAEYQSTYEDSQDLYQMQEESIARMMELNPQISNSSAIQYHIVRLMQTKLAHKHYPWLIRLMKPWSNDDVEQLCSQTYSLLSTKLEHSLKEQPTQTTAVWNDLKVLIDQWFPEIFNRSVECSRNLLSLEAILGRQPEFTAQSIQLWQQRTEWPQKKIHLPMQWQLAMQAYNTPQFKPLALQLMQRIAAEDPRSYVEAKMARVFVDTQKTETEDLWD